jgi:hypothetical protein
MNPLLEAILKDAESAAEAFILQFAVAYLNKSSGVKGAPAITAANIGKMAATVAATTVVAGITAAQTASTPATQ